MAAFHSFNIILRVHLEKFAPLLVIQIVSEVGLFGDVAQSSIIRLILCYHRLTCTQRPECQGLNPPCRSRNVRQSRARSPTATLTVQLSAWISEYPTNKLSYHMGWHCLTNITWNRRMEAAPWRYRGRLLW